MKKILYLTLVFTLLFSFVSTYNVSALDSKYETVKVGIYYSSSAKDNLTVSSDNGFQAGYMDGSAFVSLYELLENNLDVSYFSSSGIVINGTIYNISKDNLALMPNNGIVNINGTLYRGGVEFIANSSSKLTVINFVNINDYIAAVVGKEMSPSWPIEALKAQAVCARSYFISVWNKHSSQGFNMCNLQDCQTYLGISGESQSTIRAAMETKDQILTYNGSVASTVYSSSNGGSSAYSKYVWGGDLPYLQAVKDIYEDQEEASYTPWQVTLTNSEIQNKLSSKGINIGSVYDIEVTGADEYGRTYEVTIYGTSGTHVLKNDSTRSFFGLRSQKYTILTKNDKPVSSSPSDTDAVYSISSSGSFVVSDYNILSSSGVSASKNTLFALGKNGKQSFNPITTSTPPALSVDTSKIEEGSYLFNGTGWGHGVGMSQWGAKAMADRGFDYKDILNFYFNGTTLQ